MKRMIFKHTFVLSLLAPLMLTGCSQEEDLLPEADRVANFTASIDEVNTRMSDTSWDSGDKIGISCTTGSKTYTNVLYTTSSGNGVFSSTSGILYQSAASVTFNAYYPYQSSGGTVSVSTAAANQTTANKKNIDFLYATGTGSISSPTVNLAFSHKMSQVILQFEQGTGVDLTKLTEYTISGLYLNGTFNTTTGATATTGSTGSITQSVSTTSTSYTAPALILLPQTVSSNTLSLTVKVDGVNYSATLTIPSTNSKKLIAGKGLKFKVTLNKKYVSVDDAFTIDAWSYTGSNAAADSNIHLVTAENAEQYALAFKNGLFLNIWDTNTGAINTDVWAMFEADSNLKNNVAGIVYWLGDPSTDDPILQAHHPSCTHGLIVALNDAVDGEIEWQGRYISEVNEYYYAESIFDKFQSWETNGVSINQGYNSIDLVYEDEKSKSDNYDKNIANLNKILGYNNTYVLRRYNATRVITIGSDYEVTTIAAIDTYAKDNPAPNGSSGWFLPSPKELVLLANGTSNINFSADDYCDKCAVLTNTNSIITALGIKRKLRTATGYYWSSSEVANHTDRTYAVVYSDGMYGIIWKITKGSLSDTTLRAVAAF